MTLTEQWIKGELPDGLYYCKLACFNYEPTVAKCKSGCIGLASFSKNEEVLAPVPSYDDWVYLHKARNDSHEIVESLTQENQQLKELLRECQEHLCYHHCERYTRELSDKIDNAIGEKK